MRILLVEDQYLVARALAAQIAERGHDVVGPVASASAALDLLSDQAVDGAILDIVLQSDETSFPVADHLLAQGTPYCFASAYELATLPAAHAEATRLVKPLSPQTLDLALENFALATLRVR